MNKIFTIVSFVILSVVGMSVAIAAETPKIAVVHVQRILQDSPKVADVNKKLQDEFKPRQESLSRLQETVQAHVADLNKNESVMSDADKRVAQEKVADERADFLKKAGDLQQDFNTAQTGFMKEIFEALNKIISGIAKKDGYSLVLDSQAVAFADPTLDITSEVLSEFNKP